MHSTRQLVVCIQPVSVILGWIPQTGEQIQRSRAILVRAWLQNIAIVFHNFYACIVNFLTLGLYVDRSDYSREFLKLRNHEMRSFNLTKIDKDTLTKVSSVLVTNLMCLYISANVFLQQLDCAKISSFYISNIMRIQSS